MPVCKVGGGGEKKNPDLQADSPQSSSLRHQMLPGLVDAAQFADSMVPDESSDLPAAHLPALHSIMAPFRGTPPTQPPQANWPATAPTWAAHARSSPRAHPQNALSPRAGPPSAPCHVKTAPLPQTHSQTEPDSAPPLTESASALSLSEQASSFASRALEAVTHLGQPNQATGLAARAMDRISAAQQSLASSTSTSPHRPDSGQNPGQASPARQKRYAACPAQHVPAASHC